MITVDHGIASEDGERKMNCKLARISIPREEGESPRKYVDNIPATESARDLANWVLDAEGDNAAYVVVDGMTMQAEYVVFEGKIFEPRSRRELIGKVCPPPRHARERA